MNNEAEESMKNSELLKNKPTSMENHDGSISENLEIKKLSKIKKVTSKIHKPKVQKQKIQIPLYTVSYIILNLVTGMIPMYIILGYFEKFIASFMITTNYSFQASISLEFLIAVLFFPPIIFLAYIIYLLSTISIVKYIFKYIDKKEPPIEGSFKRTYESNERFLKFHNLKAFYIRFIKFKLVRCPFPWIINSAWNYLSLGKIGKNVVFEDIYHPYEFFEAEDNVYIGTASRIVTQTVEGSFGRVIFQKIKFGKNSVMTNMGIMGPGCEIGENSILLPNSACPKAYRLKANKIFRGAPPLRVSSKKAPKIFFENPEDYPDFFPKFKKEKKVKKEKKEV